MNETDIIKKIAEVISTLPPDEHKACTELVELFRTAVSDGGVAYLAFIFVASELLKGDANQDKP